MSKKRLARGFAVFILMLFQPGCDREEPATQTHSPVSFSEKVNVETIKTEKIPLFYEAVGTVKARTSTILSSKIQGHIKSIYVTEGTRVRSGKTLIVIDDRDIQAKLSQVEAAHESAKRSLDEVNIGIGQAKTRKKQAEAELSLAQTTFNRFEKLYKNKAISEQEFDSVRAKLRVAEEVANGSAQKIEELFAKKEAAKAEIEGARAQVEEVNVMKSFTTIKAPFSGIIVKKHIDVGSLAAPGVPLLSIENSEGFRLEVDVRAEEFVSQVRVGKKVDVFLDAFGTKKIKGQVAEIVPTANSLSRTFKVKIALPHVKGIKSGMYGKAICSRGERRGILIPKTALIKKGQLEQVFSISKDSFARLRLVKTGKEFEDKVEVLAGLKAGDVLISIYKPGLKGGYKVEVAK